MIYKFQPFSTSKELGIEYNAHCALVPRSEDWILILDYDCLVLSPEAYRLMELAIERYPAAEIFGAVTNRVGYKQQLLDHKLSDNDSLEHHLLVAKDLAKIHGGGDGVPITTAAGFFLLFKKSYWEANNFQQSIYDPLTMRLFDWNFCEAAMQRKTVMMIKGIYVWHTYRFLQPNYKSQKHLK